MDLSLYLEQYLLQAGHKFSDVTPWAPAVSVMYYKDGWLIPSSPYVQHSLIRTHFSQCHGFHIMIWHHTMVIFFNVLAQIWFIGIWIYGSFSKGRMLLDICQNLTTLWTMLHPQQNSKVSFMQLHETWVGMIIEHLYKKKERM